LNDLVRDIERTSDARQRSFGRKRVERADVSCALGSDLIREPILDRLPAIAWEVRVDIGHLAPVPYTKEAVEVFIKNISRVKRKINAPLILENITYNVRFPSSEMSEAEFIRKVLEETDCGLLLDVTNLYINSKNFNFDWRRFLDELPVERIVQLHFVGLRKNKNLLIDAHADRTGDEIWTVFREVCRRADVKGAILERDENFPPFIEILEEIETAKSLFKNPNLKELSAV